MLVTEAAQQHFRDLIKKEESPGMQLRVYVANPGTPYAEIGLTFCPEEEAEKSDLTFNFSDFQLYMDSAAKEALKDARIDFQEDAFGGQLSIKAPFLRGQAPTTDSSLSERIQYVLDAEINPTLSGHGGRVKLVEILDNNVVMLQFGGGCHGCGMANATLKNGIEKTLKERFPELTEVRDVTDHSKGENPYYSAEKA